MKSCFICTCTIAVLLIVCNITPSQAVCATPSKYSSFQALVSGTCNAKQWVFSNARCKECMYLDSQGRKTIGVAFNLASTNAKAILAKAGADYNQIVEGAPTAFKTKCDCKTVTCLNPSQIEYIFDESIAEAIGNAKSVVPSFASFCCTVQVTVVDVAFALGKSTFSTYTQFVYWLEHQNWKAAGDYLRTSKWCQVEPSLRCEKDADNLLYDGCPCSGRFSNSNCYVFPPSCCEESQTCCNGTLTIKNVPHHEMLCCKHPNAICCGQNKCCPAEYPLCCFPNRCCGKDDRCGDDGKCHSPTGIPSGTNLSELIFPKIL